MDKYIGAQYYTIRDFTQSVEDFDLACKKISDIGYKTVQISGTPLGAKEMREVLDKYGLKVLTSHRSYDDFLKNIDEIIDYNKTLGCDLCGIGGYFGEKNKFFDTIGGVCDTLKSEGMYFGYHNHSFEFIKEDGVAFIDRLIEETDPEVFNFIADTYWIHVGGRNPAEFIKRLGKRAMAVHFKDYSPKPEDWGVPEMREIGRGNLDWDGIIDACEKAGTRWAIVEQDGNHIENDPFLALSVSYKFLKEKGFC